MTKIKAGGKNGIKVLNRCTSKGIPIYDMEVWEAEIAHDVVITLYDANMVGRAIVFNIEIKDGGDEMMVSGDSQPVPIRYMRKALELVLHNRFMISRAIKMLED